MKRKVFYPYVFLFVVSACGGSKQHATEQMVSGPNSIAHAGGGIDGVTYTNSYEALDSSVEKGFGLIEIDFSWTEDGELVCVHDWDNSMLGVLGFALSEAPTLLEFENLIDTHGIYQPCTITGLFEWLGGNPEVKIVTDVKQQNIIALEKISHEYPEFKLRFIPQIHFPEEYAQVIALGYEDIIWTLYKYSGGTAEVLNALKPMQLFALTMSQNRMKKGLAIAIKADSSLLNTTLYTYSVNQQSQIVSYRRDWAIDEVYTDFLAAIASQGE